MSSKDVEFLITLYAALAVIGAVVCAAIFVGEKPKFLGKLESEGRAVAGVLFGIFWPLIGVAFVVKFAPHVMRGFGRGVAQLWRIVRPKKPDLPRAELRR